MAKYVTEKNCRNCGCSQTDKTAREACIKVLYIKHGIPYPPISSISHCHPFEHGECRQNGYKHHISMNAHIDPIDDILKTLEMNDD